MSPYFSPNSAIAPAAIASSRGLDLGLHRRVRQICSLTIRSISRELLARHGAEVHEVEAQPVRRDERSRLLDVRPEHLAQRRVQQVRRGVVAARRVADRHGDTSAVTTSRCFSVPCVDRDRVQPRPAGRRGPCPSTSRRRRPVRRCVPDVRHLAAGFEIERRLARARRSRRARRQRVAPAGARRRTAPAPACRPRVVVARETRSPAALELRRVSSPADPATSSPRRLERALGARLLALPLHRARRSRRVERELARPRPCPR